LLPFDDWLIERQPMLENLSHIVERRRITVVE
jgi:hypothetical protein